jgi:RES domain-containing protein
LRLVTTAFRAHDPRWAWSPTSGDGAALHGGRFNPKDTSALYLGLSMVGAVKEASQGFGFKIHPMLICSYEVDCEAVEDLRDVATCKRLGVAADDLSCGWLSLAASGDDPPTWALARRLIADGVAGIVTPSFAPGANPSDANLVLWRWGPDLPHQVRVHDPDGRLPQNDRSWR